MHFLRELWDNVREFVTTVGSVALFFGRVLAQLPRAFLRPSLVVEQVHNTGALSLVIIMTCGLFVGMVLGLTGYDLLQRFGSEEALGTAGALAVVKELGPVVTALLFAGRAGTALASEIGLMRATDQLTAMEMMAVDPMRRVIAPRFAGGIIAMPLLTVIFIAIGIFGVQLVGVQQFKVDAASFWSQSSPVSRTPLPQNGPHVQSASQVPGHEPVLVVSHSSPGSMFASPQNGPQVQSP